MISFISMSQSWDWYKKPYDTLSDTWFTISHHDIYNNYYVMGHYYDTILFPDTAFIHSTNVQGSFEAVARYNANGIFQDAFDIYTLDNDIILNSQMMTNSKGDMFISGGFQQVAYVNGYEILNGDSVSYWYPDVYVVKMDKDFNILWADIIGGRFQDDLLDIDLTEDENIVITTSHYGVFNYFLSQDTTYYEDPFIAISLINDEKEFIWGKDILGNVYGHTSVGEDQNIHFFGRCWTDFIIDGDTIFNPNPNHHPSKSLKNISITISPEGEILDARYLDFAVLFWEALYNENGGLYAYGRVSDTVVFQNDTLIGTEYGGNNALIAKFDESNDVEWYKYLQTPEGYNFNYSFLPFELKNNHLYFSISADNDFNINDDLISSERPIKSFFTEIDEDGNLLWTKIMEGDFRLRVVDIVLDNCDNIFFNLFYNGNVFFDQDTISTYSDEYYQDLFGKLALKSTSLDVLGPDTIVCDSILLSAPEGYVNYIWNDSLIGEHDYFVEQSGIYHIVLGDENNCWQYDTIQIDIQNGFTFDLGADTNILGNDTINIGPSAFEVYDSYLWSDSTTYNIIQIIGNQHGIGEFPIWLEATAGVCSFRDTLLLTVDQGYGIENLDDGALKLYPNPSSDQILIEITEEDWMNLSFTVYDLNGKKQKEGIITNKSQFIDIQDLKTGMYLLFISNPSKKEIKIRKFIKE